MMRVGQVIGVKPEGFEQYKALHANAWPEVNRMIRACNIRNYSIYHYNGLLFAYFEYIGDDYAGDMAKMAEDPKTQEWWGECMPCQQPVAEAKDGEWWVDIEELYHLD